MKKSSKTVIYRGCTFLINNSIYYEFTIDNMDYLFDRESYQAQMLYYFYHNNKHNNFVYILKENNFL